MGNRAVRGARNASGTENVARNGAERCAERCAERGIRTRNQFFFAPLLFCLLWATIPCSNLERMDFMCKKCFFMFFQAFDRLYSSANSAEFCLFILLSLSNDAYCILHIAFPEPTRPRFLCAKICHTNHQNWPASCCDAVYLNMANNFWTKKQLLISKGVNVSKYWKYSILIFENSKFII